MKNEKFLFLESKQFADTNLLSFSTTLTLAPSFIWTLTNGKEDACAYLSDVSVYLSIGEVKYCNLMGTKKITD